MANLRYSVRVGALLSAFFWIPTLMAETQQEVALKPVDRGQKAETPPSNWLDRSHEYASRSSDRLASWIDHFFGASRTDQESAYSSLRLSLENDWEEGEGSDQNLRLRGKVHLPRINERLSLIFSDEEQEGVRVDSAVDSVTGKKENAKVGLQYNVQDKQRSRLDFNLGVRSSFKAKANVRHRYEIPVGEHYLHRFTQTAFYIDGEGFGVRSRYELDRSLDDHRLLRWANHIKFSEDTEGLEWATRLSLGDKLNEQSAVSYFVWTGGETRPDTLTTSYGFGVRYRRSFYRPWLFYELEPAYAWKRELPEMSREGTGLFTATLEIQLEQLARRVR